MNIELFKPLLSQCKEHIEQSINTLQVAEKEGSDLVTNLDIEIENMIIEFIRSHFPDDDIIAEESSVKALESKTTWIIDPIDGTVNFSYGLPLFGIQFCRMTNGTCDFAVLYLPQTDEIYYALKNKGAYCNGAKLEANTDFPLHLSLVSFGDFSKSSYDSRPIQMNLIDELKEQVLKIRIFGSSCFDFASLASCKTQCHIMFSKRIWEFNAGLFLLEEAGIHTCKIKVPQTDIIAICGAHNPALLENIKTIIHS